MSLLPNAEQMAYKVRHPTTESAGRTAVLEESSNKKKCVGNPVQRLSHTNETTDDPQRGTQHERDYNAELRQRQLRKRYR